MIIISDMKSESGINSYLQTILQTECVISYEGVIWMFSMYAHIWITGFPALGNLEVSGIFHHAVSSGLCPASLKEMSVKV